MAVVSTGTDTTGHVACYNQCLAHQHQLWLKYNKPFKRKKKPPDPPAQPEKLHLENQPSIYVDYSLYEGKRHIGLISGFRRHQFIRTRRVSWQRSCLQFIFPWCHEGYTGISSTLSCHENSWYQFQISHRYVVAFSVWIVMKQLRQQTDWFTQVRAVVWEAVFAIIRRTLVLWVRMRMATSLQKNVLEMAVSGVVPKHCLRLIRVRTVSVSGETFPWLVDFHEIRHR